MERSSYSYVIRDSERNIAGHRRGSEEPYAQQLKGTIPPLAKLLARLHPAPVEKATPFFTLRL
jgi:hypothetical protein